MKQLNKNIGNRNLTLLTDFYQLTMAQGYFSKNRNETVIFNYYFRKIPQNGGYAIFAGLEPFIDYIENLCFTEQDIEYLKSYSCFTEEFLNYLKKEFKFTGNIEAIPEGTAVFPNDIIVKVTASLIEAQIIETALLLMLNHQTLIATKASRVCYAADGDPVLEFGSRRAQGADASIYGARSAIIAGCAGTSNVIAGKMFEIPVSGTHAHSWVMSFPTEEESFMAYADTFEENVLLLVDTYDTINGVKTAIKTFENMKKTRGKMPEKYGIRLDSGDLAYLSKEARKMLDKAGFKEAKICASNDLDEKTIMALKYQGAKIDTWGVGTKLITSYDEPALGGVYKLVAIEEDKVMVPKIKIAENDIKVTDPGDKKTLRLIDKKTNKFIADLIALDDETFDTNADLTIFDPKETYKQKTLKGGTYIVQELMVPIFKNGKMVYEIPSIMDIQARCKDQINNLSEEVLRLENAHKYYVDLSQKLYDLKHKLIKEARKNSIKE